MRQLKKTFETLVETRDRSQWWMKIGVYQDFEVLTTRPQPTSPLLPPKKVQPPPTYLLEMTSKPLAKYQEEIAQQILVEEDKQKQEQNQNMWFNTAVVAVTIATLGSDLWVVGLYEVADFLSSYARNDFDGPFSWARDTMFSNILQKLMYRRIFPLMGDVGVEIVSDALVNVTKTGLDDATGRKNLSPAGQIMARIWTFKYMCDPALARVARDQEKAKRTLSMEELGRR
jgi:hypothetical protein